MNTKKGFSLAAKVSLSLTLLAVIGVWLLTNHLEEKKNEYEKEQYGLHQVEATEQEAEEKARYGRFVASVPDLHCEIRSKLGEVELPEGYMRDRLIAKGIRPIEPKYTSEVDVISVQKELLITFAIDNGNVDYDPISHNREMTDNAITTLRTYAKDCVSKEHQKYYEEQRRLEESAKPDLAPLDIE